MKSFHTKSWLAAKAILPVYRFWAMDFQQMATIVDLLRNEKTVKFGWYEENPILFHLMIRSEPVGEGDIVLAEDQELLLLMSMCFQKILTEFRYLLAK